MQEIIFRYEIGAKSIEWLLNESRRSVGPKRVWIDSPGGTFDFFSKFGPPLERQGLTTVGVDVRSAAIILFLLGYQRLAVPSLIFFFHEVRVIPGRQGEITVCDVETARHFINDAAKREGFDELLFQMKSAQHWMVSYISSLSGIPKSLFVDLMQREVTLCAREAIRYGIAHRVLEREEVVR